MRFKIFRSGVEEKNARYDTFEIDPTMGMTVLSALFEIRERFDESLAFRYSCRGAVCGTCAMLINRVPRLACRTQIEKLLKGEGAIHLAPFIGSENSKESWNQAEEVLVEPMPHMPVIRDLIVDMTHFFECYRLTEPVFKPNGLLPEKEQRMDQSDVEAVEMYANCILCGACFAACPVNAKNPVYWGPAALAKLYRFHIDPRELRDGSRLFTADVPEGWWSCEFHLNCTHVCPKGVPPSTAIGKAELELKRGWKKYTRNTK
ncbi:MAG: succinate dehydrogenase/fumarate reductase iron-sulfur subunit, partial [Methanomicrobiales archaeon]|nr:succinate dehydrogenase/fumarate reductase iron-sulfur subunit [Methanomicrobiales archaeon]